MMATARDREASPPNLFSLYENAITIIGTNQLTDPIVDPNHAPAFHRIRFSAVALFDVHILLIPSVVTLWAWTKS